ncbi:MAG: InlB B-repeat-containing protein [Eubacterium sp.]|nr:InlB B-repeat-containing protein [Eubacterium sp.]
MKKRLFPILMAILMVFAMMPMTVFAESDKDLEDPVVDSSTLNVTITGSESNERKATIGDTITFSIDASDNRGVNEVIFFIKNPEQDGSKYFKATYVGNDEDRKTGRWTAEVTVDNQWENGTWKLDEIDVTDVSGRYRYYYDSNNYPTQIYKWDMSQWDFTVHGSSLEKDFEDPVVDSSTLNVTITGNESNERKATVGDKVTFSIDASDNWGVNEVIFFIKNPEQDGSKYFKATYVGNDEDRKTGRWTAEVTVGDQWENDTWKLSEVDVIDVSGRYRFYYDSNIYPTQIYKWDMSQWDFTVYQPTPTSDLSEDGYSMMMDGAGATTTFGGNYYVVTTDGTVVPDTKVRFEDEIGWTTLAARKYTLKYEKKTGDNSWEDYTSNTFGLDDGKTATYRVSAIGKESEGYTGTVGPVEFNVIKKNKVTFDTRGGSSVDPQYVIPGERASKPDDPTKDGLVFKRWCSDEELTTEYNFSSSVNADTTVYAEWYAQMAIGIYNDSNPKNKECGTVDVETPNVNVSQQDVTAMNFNSPEGTVKFTAKPAEGYKFKGFYKGVFGDSGYVQTPSEDLLSDEDEYTCGATELAVCAVFECAGHQWEEKIQKATPTADGRIYQKCSICGTEEIVAPLLKVSKISLAGTSYTYTGKAITPKVTVANASETLSADNYTVTYSGNTNAGTATAKVTLKGDYYEGSKSLTFKINKAANPLTMKPKTGTVKYAKLKKKAQTLAVTKVIKFTKDAKDKKTYTLSSAKKGKKSFKKYFKINKSTGKVTVKKGLKKGTYKVKVKVKALGNSNYKASGTKTVTFKVKVK